MTQQSALSNSKYVNWSANHSNPRLSDELLVVVFHYGSPFPRAAYVLQNSTSPTKRSLRPQNNSSYGLTNGPTSGRMTGTTSQVVQPSTRVIFPLAGV